MRIKKFTGSHAQEIIRRVKQEMGPDAVIIRTKTLQQPGDGDGNTRKVIEVTAAVDYDPNYEGNRENPVIFPPNVEVKWERLTTEVRELRELLWAFQAHAGLSPEIRYNEPLRDRYGFLKRIGLNEEAIKRFVVGAGRDDSSHGQPRPSKAQNIRQCLLDVINAIPVSGERCQPRGEQEIRSFIGPTGAGKTTTLAKLAAINAVRRKKKVALLTLDTFRIAAVAQLETYARIMALPMEVVHTKDDIIHGISKHRDCDLIFIDTTGRSPNNQKEIAEMGAFLDMGERIHHYLVLPATARYGYLSEAEKQFGVLPIGSYIFTKLDEVEDTSDMINFLLTKQQPLSYVTTGQQVPEDIASPTKKTLASMVLNKCAAGDDRSMAEVC
jgi:flagellar biosynthesis protein FlhF